MVFCPKFLVTKSSVNILNTVCLNLQ